MPLVVQGRCQPLEHVVCVMRWMDLSSSKPDVPSYTFTYNAQPVVSDGEGLWTQELNVYAFEMLMRAQFDQMLSESPTTKRFGTYEYIMVHFYTVDTSYTANQNIAPRILRSSNNILFVGCIFNVNESGQNDFVHAQKMFQPVDYAWNKESPLFFQLNSHPIEMIHVEQHELGDQEMKDWLKQPSGNRYTGMPSVFMIKPNMSSFANQTVGTIEREGLCSSVSCFFLSFLIDHKKRKTLVHTGSDEYNRFKTDLNKRLETSLQRLLFKLTPSPQNVAVWVKVFAAVDNALLTEKQGKESIDENGWNIYRRFFNDLNGLQHESKDEIQTRSNEIMFVMDLMEELELNNTQSISTLMSILAYYSATTTTTS